MSMHVISQPNFVNAPGRAYDLLWKDLPWKRSDLSTCRECRMGYKTDEKTWQLLPLTFRDLIDAIYRIKFNDCVIFGFDNIKDRMRWFDESGYNLNKPIAIIMIGAAREIQFKYKKSAVVEQMTLESGSLTIINRNANDLFEYKIVQQPVSSIALIYQMSLS